MDSIKFYKLQKTLKENNIMFCYSGYVTQKILVAIGETIKKKLEVEETELGKTKKVFSRRQLNPISAPTHHTKTTQKNIAYALGVAEGWR